jgi:hypothetical protein
MGLYAARKPPTPEQRQKELSRPSDYPDGMDVVVAGVAADGVEVPSARRLAHRMLQPLERCYRRHVDDQAKTAPQGRLVVTARIASDGTVDHVRVDVASGLPDDLVACALSSVREGSVTAPTEDLASVEIDLRFVYRTLPAEPLRTAADENR